MNVPANVTPYRDRHGKERWRYRKGSISVHLPGRPGDQAFDERAGLAAAGLVRQRDRLAHPSRLLFLHDFARGTIWRTRLRAIDKKVPFSITQEEIVALMEAQGWRCSVSGIPFYQRRGSDAAFKPTLDRIVPRLGYVAGNVRVVAYIVNVAMNKWGEEPLWKLIEVMATRLEGRQPARTDKKSC